MGRQDEWEESDEIADDWEEELEQPSPAPPMQPAGKKDAMEKNGRSSVNETEVERKQRLELAVKRADLQNTIDLFGVDGADIDTALQDACVLSDKPSHRGEFESADPQSIPEFDKFAGYIADHLNSRLAQRKNYPAFLESLVRQLCSTRDLTLVRKISSLVQDLALAKQKEQKASGPGAVAVAAGVSAAQQQQQKAGKKKAPVLLATKKGRDLDTTDYGSVCYDEEDY